MSKKIYKKQYKKLCEWVNSNGFEVKESCRALDRVEFSEKTIYINSQYKYENKLYTLLHECGHLKTDKNLKTFLKYHPIYSTDQSDGRIIKSKAYKVCLVSEELKAWHNGFRLAKKLGFEINKKNYDKVMVDSVFTYISWAGRVE